MWFLLSFAHCSPLATHLLNIDHLLAEPGCQGFLQQLHLTALIVQLEVATIHLDAHIDSDFVCRFILQWEQPAIHHPWRLYHALGSGAQGCTGTPDNDPSPSLFLGTATTIWLDWQ